MRFFSQVKMVKTLLSLGADASLLDNDARSVFHICSKNKNTKCYQLLTTHLATMWDPNLALDVVGTPDITTLVPRT